MACLHFVCLSRIFKTRQHDTHSLTHSLASLLVLVTLADSHSKDMRSFTAVAFLALVVTVSADPEVCPPTHPPARSLHPYSSLCRARCDSHQILRDCSRHQPDPSEHVCGTVTSSCTFDLLDMPCALPYALPCARTSVC
jgi:hypothetical protein